MLSAVHSHERNVLTRRRCQWEAVLALSCLSCETRKRALKVWTSVGNSRCRAVTWGWGEDLITLKIPLGSCPKHFVPKYWEVTLVMSPYVPFFCTPFIPPPPFFFFTTFLLFHGENLIFLDSLVVYGSICVPLAPHPVGLDASLSQVPKKFG